MLELNLSGFIVLFKKLHMIELSILVQPMAISHGLDLESDPEPSISNKIFGLSFLQQHKESLKKNREAAESLRQTTNKALGEALQEIDEECTALGLQFSSMEVQRCIRKYEVKGTLDTTDIESISVRVIDELKTHLFFQTKPENRFYYQDAIKKWKDVTDKHSELIEDIDGAGRSITFEMYTASVFHLMRIMERGLKLLGAKFDVPDFEEKQWNTIVQIVRGEIESRWPAHGKSLTGAEKELRQNYNESLAYLTAVKNAWRNSVMHPKDTYTQEEAISIYNSVQAFMRNLVSLT